MKVIVVIAELKFNTYIPPGTVFPIIVAGADTEPTIGQGSPLDPPPVLTTELFGLEPVIVIPFQEIVGLTPGVGGVIKDVQVIHGTVVGVIVGVGGFVGVKVGVLVTVGVTVLVGVIVGVTVLVGVIVGVTDCVGVGV